MEMYVNGIEITAKKLKDVLNNLDSEEVIELEEVDEYGNLYFFINKYELHY